jgi:hypothetical protein
MDGHICQHERLAVSSVFGQVRGCVRLLFPTSAPAKSTPTHLTSMSLRLLSTCMAIPMYSHTHACLSHACKYTCTALHTNTGVPHSQTALRLLCRQKNAVHRLVTAQSLTVAHPCDQTICRTLNATADGVIACGDSSKQTRTERGTEKMAHSLRRSLTMG